MRTINLPEAYANFQAPGAMEANHGQLTLELKKNKNGKTFIARQYFTLPLQILPPGYQDEDGTPFLYILNPTGGILQHDKLEVQISLDNGCSALITTPSATKIYRMEDGYASQSGEFNVAQDAVLEYLPDINIPYKDSKYVQTTDFNLDKSATLITWDIIASGRIARGEAFEYDFYDSELNISVDGKKIVCDRMQLKPKASPINGIGLMENHNLLANVYVYAEGISTNMLSLVRDLLRNYGQLQAGITQPEDSLLIIRILADKAWYIQEALHSVWDLLRKDIIGKPAARIRK